MSHTKPLLIVLTAVIVLHSLAFGRGNCNDVPLQLIVAPPVAGQGSISGDGAVIYNNPNDPTFNGGTLYQDGVNGVYVRFQVCNGTNDFILNLRQTARYINLDFSVELSAADTVNGALDLTGRQLHQQGEQINEMANAALYTNEQFTTCSGMMLDPLSSTVTGGNAWYKPTTTYDPAVPDCTGGTSPDLANQTPNGINTSSVLVRQIDACTWTASPILDRTGSWYRVGIAETVKTGGHTSISVEGGQYQMPFSYKIQRLNCTP